MSWFKILSVVMWLIEKVAVDTDGDGYIDLFDKEPKNPEVH